MGLTAIPTKAIDSTILIIKTTDPHEPFKITVNGNWTSLEIAGTHSAVSRAFRQHLGALRAKSFATGDQEATNERTAA